MWRAFTWRPTPASPPTSSGAGRVRWVVAYEPSRIQSTAADLLGLNPPPPRFMDLALYERPQFAPRYLRLVMVNPYFKMYEVRVDSLPHE